MQYTWGYIKEAALAKLNLSEKEANEQGFLSSFPYYANEAMTQICSAVFAKEVFFAVRVQFKQQAWEEITKKYQLYLDEKKPIPEPVISPLDEFAEQKTEFWNEWNSYYFVGEPIEFPEDFIKFSNDVALYRQPPIMVAGQIVKKCDFVEAFDNVLYYQGYNEVICMAEGDYRIPYAARWFFFTKDTQNDVKISAPSDVLDCLPSYIASQCYRIDDERMSQMLRNEYEIFLARIDDTSFRSQRTINIGGNW